MNTLGLVLIMGGALLIWAGLTDNSIVELLKGITGQSNSKAKKNSNNGGATAAGAGGGGGGRKH